VKELPEEFDETALVASLADGWGFEVERAEYADVGFGSYHWLATERDGTRGFVTVDDLDRKPWLGDTRESTFDGLRRAFDAAAALRDAGLHFVVAPIRTSGGETVRLLSPRLTIALFPFVDGRAGRYGEYETAEERAAVVRMLAELHDATPAVRGLARRADLDLPGRRHLEAGLQSVTQPWVGGPLSEPARRVLASHASDVAGLLQVFDRRAAQLATGDTEWVVTHGEPHAANVLQAEERLVLVDWDTVAVARPERDLWMVLGAAEDEIGLYAEATGYRVDSAAIEFFRIAWDLADLAVYVTLFRSRHREDEDTLKAFGHLAEYATIRDRWGTLLGST
jgi:spectinomycin phosphotransferase